MPKRILIDAIHPEEVRVVIADNKRLEDFDFESSAKKPIKGNIYLAKVTRVEPSLQAAFVEYGGNKQGFLPFAEIHPSYYQIPVSDQAVMRSSEQENRYSSQGPAQEEDIIPFPSPITDEARFASAGEQISPEEGRAETGPEGATDTAVDIMDDDVEERPRMRSSSYRRYHIQEVVKKGQVLLVQVVKEERGNKGASLSSYISLPGRFCVLMPNSERQGGVSRRIEDSENRRRLKDIIDSLETPEGMSVIIRTAGEECSKAEIRRDYDYLDKLWESVRQLTLSSHAPAMIYEEGDLIKRYIRDRFDATIQEIAIEGEQAYQSACAFMQLLMPSQVERIKLHDEPIPIFTKYQIEEQLGELYENKAMLKSGGYLVISPTEALVAIDVNSGRSTRERNVEETALKTNLEAAYEIARQVRLRDLAGLIVIDFIDMMDNRNRRAVERALRDALELDRARIQIGRISPFGLLELSRQRLRSSLLEVSTVPCTHCGGTGVVRSPGSTVVHLLRAIEHEADRGVLDPIVVDASVDAALFILNNKRDDLSAIETRYGIKVLVKSDPTLTSHQYVIENAEQKTKSKRPRRPARQERQEDYPAAASAIDPMAVAPGALESFIEAEHTASARGEEESSEPRHNNRRRYRNGPRGGNYGHIEEGGDGSPPRQGGDGRRRRRPPRRGGRPHTGQPGGRNMPAESPAPYSVGPDMPPPSDAPRAARAELLTPPPPAAPELAVVHKKKEEPSMIRELWRRITE